MEDGVIPSPWHGQVPLAIPKLLSPVPCAHAESPKASASAQPWPRALLSKFRAAASASCHHHCSSLTASSPESQNDNMELFWPLVELVRIIVVPQLPWKPLPQINILIRMSNSPLKEYVFLFNAERIWGQCKGKLGQQSPALFRRHVASLWLCATLISFLTLPLV